MGSLAPKGLAEAFYRQVRLSKNVEAVKDGEFSLTFRELHEKALCLADQILAKRQLPAESPIAILAPRGINHVLAQVAIIYAGGSCTPLDVKEPDIYLDSLLSHLNCTVIVAEGDQINRLPGYEHVLADFNIEVASRDDHVVQSIRGFLNDSSACSHIFHTSGTTGKPKAVQIPARGIINLAYCAPYRVKSKQRFAHVGNVTFDITLFEIWVSLLSGASLIILTQDVVMDPVRFCNRICSEQIDVMILTPALMAVIAHAVPSAFATLHTLFTGGEAINVPTIKKIVKNGAPQRLVNLYGPTECTVYAICHQVSSSDVEANSVPLGRVIDNMTAHVVDSELQAVESGQIGELLLEGEGVSHGYFGEPEKTAKAFVHAPHLGHQGRLYRTGDFVRVDPATGAYSFIGRRDNQVKIRGQRIELEAVELLLRETGYVRDAVVVKVQPDNDAAKAILLAFVIPAASRLGVCEATIAGEYTGRTSLMVPRVELVDRFPLTSTGKVDRRRLEQEYRSKMEETQAWAKSAREMTMVPLRKHLEMLWIEVLCLPVTRLEPTDDFFTTLGGTSLQAATLVARVRNTFGVQLSSAVLYEHSTLSRLRSVVEALRDGPAHGRGVHEDAGTRRRQLEASVWHHDCDLGKHLRPAAGALVDWTAPNEGRAFLTGATGFVGAFLLVELLRLPHVQRVACLIRASDAAAGWRRLRSNLDKYNIFLEPGMADRILVVAGDLRHSRLGLVDDNYELLAGWASVVFHLGAHVHYVQPYAHHRAANVLGTLHMLTFASHGRPKALHYTSSLAAFGPSGGVLGHAAIAEDERPRAHMAALHYDTGYSQSQMVAESIVWNAIDNGLPAAVFRPGFVLGHSRTGISNRDDFVGRLFASCLATGSYPLLPDQREEFIPVDFVVAAMLAVAQQPSRLRRAYNLIQPRQGAAIDMNTAFALLSDAARTPLRPLPYSRWVDAFSPEAQGPLHPLMPMLQEKVLGDRTRWEVRENMAVYGTHNLCAALRDHCPSLLECEPMCNLFRRYLEHWLVPRL